MSNGLTFEILTQISRNFQDERRNICKDYLQNIMEIDQELIEKSAKSTQRWWMLTATIGVDYVMFRLRFRLVWCVSLLHLSLLSHDIVLFHKLACQTAVYMGNKVPDAMAQSD